MKVLRSSRPGSTTCSSGSSSSRTRGSIFARMRKRRPRGRSSSRSLDVGRGVVAKMLVQNGTLHVGDVIVARRRCRQGSHALRLPRREGTRGPAQRAGQDHRLRLRSARRRARSRCRGHRQARRSPRSAPSGSVASSSRSARRRPARDARDAVRADAVGRASRTLNVILKGDVRGSIEAIERSCEARASRSTRERAAQERRRHHGGRRLRCAGVGRDHHRLQRACRAEARQLAERKGVQIRRTT